VQPRQETDFDSVLLLTHKKNGKNENQSFGVRFSADECMERNVTQADSYLFFFGLFVFLFPVRKVGIL
jgi:hypothetical protein